MDSLPILPERSKVLPSLVFTPSDAASYDERIIWEIGKTGILELATLDPIFTYWQERFFSNQAFAQDRALLTQDENDLMDLEIRHFLLTLGPYLGDSNAAHRAMEWMIRKYRVHVLNVDSMFLSALPYHDGDELFVRLMQMANLRGPSAGAWTFLQDMKKKGQEFSRRFLGLRCAVDPKLLTDIYEAIKWQVEQVEWTRKPSEAVSFFSLLACEYITALEERSRAEEAATGGSLAKKASRKRRKTPMPINGRRWDDVSMGLLSRIVNGCISDGAKNECPDWQLTGMVVFMHLASVVGLQRETVEQVRQMVQSKVTDIARKDAFLKLLRV